MSKVTDDRIDTLRSRLYETVQQANGNLKDAAVLRDSQKLDVAILQAMVHSVQNQRKR